MPEVKKLVTNKKALIIASAVFLVLLISLITWAIISSNVSRNTKKLSVNPEYHTVLPNGKSIESLGGWSRISPSDKDPVYAYSDKIDGKSITVSQQALPEAFVKDGSSRVADVAEKFNATNKITAADTTVYIGTSIKGPQSVIFAREDLLILIKSQEKIADEAWTKYINSLGFELKY